MSRFIIFLFSIFLLTSCSSLSPDESYGNIIPDSAVSKKNIKPSDGLLEERNLSIALLVPLSKQKENISNPLIKAAQLAVMDANRPEINLIILDSDLLDANPKALLSKLTEQKVKVIIGPLYGSDTAKLISLVKDKNVTILSLSNDSSIKAESLLMMGISPDSQAVTITNHAISNGVEHLHLLLPNNKFGQLIDAAVESIVVDKSNITHSVNWYNQDNAEQIIDQVVSSIDNKPSQAIFMPQGGSNLSLLDTSLKKHKRNKVTLMGLQSWDNPNILELDSLNGAIFIRKNLAEEQFYDNFSRTFNLAANNIDFITYNSLMMAINMYRDQVHLDKNSIIENNRSYGKYSDVIFDTNGLSLYKLSVVKIQDKEFKLVDNIP